MSPSPHILSLYATLCVTTQLRYLTKTGSCLGNHFSYLPYQSVHSWPPLSFSTKVLVLVPYVFGLPKVRLSVYLRPCFGAQIQSSSENITPDGEWLPVLRVYRTPEYHRLTPLTAAYHVLYFSIASIEL